MVTEFVIILTAMLVVISLFVNTLKATFKGSGPKLGARVEKQIETGSGFPVEASGGFGWEAPPKKPGDK
jgi:hypothetical protein